MNNYEALDILFLNVTNKDWFTLSLQTINSYLSNYRNIFILQTNQDLSQFNDVIVCNQTLFQFMKKQDVSQSVIVMEENMGFLDNVKANYIPITYEIIDNVYYQDHLKPQLVEREKFLNLPEQQYENPLTEYYKSIDRIGIPNYSYTVNTTKPICCRTKSLLKICQYVRWNDKSFQSLKKYLNSK